MNLNEATIKSLISKKFIVDCISIKLTQESSSDPIIYSGPGSIYQQEDGYFYLKIYHSFKDIHKENYPNFSPAKIGKPIPDDHYFRMEATDMSGDYWSAMNILVSPGSSFPAAGKVIVTKVKSLDYREQFPLWKDKNDKSKLLFMILPGKFNIPCNKAEDLPNGGWVFNTTEFEIHGVFITLIDKKDYLTIKVLDPGGNIDDVFRLRLLESLNIVFGKYCFVLYSSFKSEINRIVKLYSISIDIPNHELESPIKHQSRNDLESFTQFVDRYMNCFNTNGDHFYGYWFNIQRSWQGAYENSAQAITIAIEGVIKKYFSEFCDPDKYFKIQADIAKEHIKSLVIGTRIKQGILSNLGNLKSPKPKTALYNLASKGKINRELVDVWVRRRNQSVHPVIIDEYDRKMEKNIDEIYACLNLFYLLLLIKIEFKGIYQDLSKEGWPETRFGI